MERVEGPRLSGALRTELLDRLSSSDTVGILLGGSYARGEETGLSDIDLSVFRRSPDARPGENRHFLARTEARLVSWAPTTVDRELERMRRPETAIWVVPGIRQGVPLLDRDGSVARVREAAESFRWEPLAAAARSFASEALAGLAEEVAKLLTGLEGHDPDRVANALSGLAPGLSQAVAVGRGVLIETENRWLRQVEESVGVDAPWSRAHRRMQGTDADLPSTLWDRAESGLRCYAETAVLFDPFLRAEDRGLVELARFQIERRFAPP